MKGQLGGRSNSFPAFVGLGMQGAGVEIQGRGFAGFGAWWDDDGAVGAGEQGEGAGVAEGDVEPVAAGRDVVEGEAGGFGELQVGLVAVELEVAVGGVRGGGAVGAEEDGDVAGEVGGLELCGDAPLHQVSLFRQCRKRYLTKVGVKVGE